MTPAPDALAAARGLADTIKRRIDIRMNNHLCEMKPDYDDSIVGFNEAWTIVRDIFAETLADVPPSTEAASLRRATEDARALRAACTKMLTVLQWTAQFSDDYWQSITHFAMSEEIETLRGNFKEIDDTIASVTAEIAALAQKETGGEL